MFDDFVKGETIYFSFNAVGSDRGASDVASGELRWYAEDGTYTKQTVGLSAPVEDATYPGLYHASIATTDAAFLSTMLHTVVFHAGTIDGVSAVGQIVYQFTLDRQLAEALRALEVQELAAKLIDIQGRIPAALVDGLIAAHAVDIEAAIVTAIRDGLATATSLADVQAALTTAIDSVGTTSSSTLTEVRKTLRATAEHDAGTPTEFYGGVGDTPDVCPVTLRVSV